MVIPLRKILVVLTWGLFVSLGISALILVPITLYSNDRYRVSLTPSYYFGKNVSEALLVHYVYLHDENVTAANSSHDHELIFWHCLGIVSVMLQLPDAQIFIHTNYPGYIPYESCRNLSGYWNDITMVYRERRVTIGGNPVEFIEHAADIAKLEVLQQYGGIALDFDVYILNGRRLRHLLEKYDCILSQEFPVMMNAGFTACRKGSTWPSDLLAIYRKDFRPDLWLYNSGNMPYNLFRENAFYRERIYADQTIANHPNGMEKFKMFERNNLVDWRRKLGFHAFIRNRTHVSMNTLNSDKSSFGDLLRYILKKSETLKAT